MASVQTRAATLEDLARVTDKAELIDGRIELLMPTGRKPARVAGRIYRSLDDYAIQSGRGEAYPDNVGFAVPRLSSGRESFAPDASYYLGPFLADPMRFLKGPPTLAALVRSESDYTPSAEAAVVAKRTDYLEAGTPIVFDVDPIAECIHIYRVGSPDHPTTVKRGQTADAEPLLPGWRVDLDWIFA
jgi:Uma2 family endonuclease